VLILAVSSASEAVTHGVGPSSSLSRAIEQLKCAFESGGQSVPWLRGGFRSQRAWTLRFFTLTWTAYGVLRGIGTFL